MARRTGQSFTSMTVLSTPTFAGRHTSSFQTLIRFRSLRSLGTTLNQSLEARAVASSISSPNPAPIGSTDQPLSMSGITSSMRAILSVTVHAQQPGASRVRWFQVAQQHFIKTSLVQLLPGQSLRTKPSSLLDMMGGVTASLASTWPTFQPRPSSQATLARLLLHASSLIRIQRTPREQHGIISAAIL